MVFCGVGKESLDPWIICQVGIVDEKDLAENTVRELKPPEKFLFKLEKDDEEEDLDEIVTTAQPRSDPDPSESEESDDDGSDGKSKAAPAGKNSKQLPKGKGTGKKNGKSRRISDAPGKGI